MRRNGRVFDNTASRSVCLGSFYTKTPSYQKIGGDFLVFSPLLRRSCCAMTARARIIIVLHKEPEFLCRPKETGRGYTAHRNIWAKYSGGVTSAAATPCDPRGNIRVS